jgi:hypothetical protein
MRNKVVIRKLLVFLTFISIAFFLFKPNPPLQTIEGAAIRIYEDQEIHKYTKPTGINEITLSLNNKRVDKVNQRRNPRLIHQFPKFFGKDSSFKPLLILKVQGPVNIEIKGDGPTGRILFHVPKNELATEWIVEVYPYYILEKLFEGKTGEIEKITISEWKTHGLKLPVETIHTQWSGPNDLFLSTKNLMDTASLTKEFSKTPTGFNIKEENLENFTRKLGEDIKSKSIRYETDLPYHEGDDRGWQLIRSPEQISKDKRANCIDIAILTAIEALKNNFKPYIWANSGHALCALSYETQSPEQAIAFEGTDYLKPPLKAPTKPGEPPREYLPEEEIIYPEREPPRGIEPKQEEIFSMDYSFWEKFYRENPKKQK